MSPGKTWRTTGEDLDQRVTQSNVNLCDSVQKSVKLRDFCTEEQVGKVHMTAGNGDLKKSCESHTCLL